MARARRGLLGAIAAAALLVSAQPAIALIPIDTRLIIVIEPSNATTVEYGGFITTKLKKGKPTLKTKKAATNCLRGRDVSVSYLGTEYGSAVTNRRGEWSVTGSKPPAGASVKILVSRDVRGKVLCGVLSKNSPPIP